MHFSIKRFMKINVC